MTSLEAGTQVLNSFNKYMQRLFDVNYTFDQLALANKFKNTLIFVEGVGDQWLVANLSYGTMDSMMYKLAYASGGKIPTKAAFDRVLREQASQTFSFIDIQNSTDNGAVYVLSGAADQVLNGVQAVGNTLIGLGGNVLNGAANAGNALENTTWLAKYALPLILIGGVALVVYYEAQKAK